MYRSQILHKGLGLLAISLMSALACNKNNLDIDPPFVTEDAYFSSEAEFNSAVLGIYAKMSDIYWYNGGANNSTHTIFLLPGDDITCSDQDEFEQFGQLQPASGRLNYFYQTLYQMVARANVVLEKTAAVADGIYKTPNLKNTHTGEAHFLRGLAYFHLFNHFGTSPLVKERVKLASQFTPSGTTGTQLLDQAIEDFSAAAGLLPASWNEANRGRATANAANGMLGKALVFKGSITGNASDYSASLAAINKIAGVNLVSKFDDNFAADAENNGESLFEFQASQPAFDNVWLSNDFEAGGVGSISAYWGFYNNNFSLFGKSRFVATTKLQNIFEAGDPRIELTMDPSNRNFKKYVTRDVATQAGVGSNNNPRILRYADVLLLKAEALLGSGGSKPDAIALINQVRTRARNLVSGGTAPKDRITTEADANIIFGWIADERLMELAGEGQRWIDLRRWHIGKKITLNNTFFGSNTNTMSFDPAKHILFPIPTSEIDQNSNIKQNPGY